MTYNRNAHVAENIIIYIYYSILVIYRHDVSIVQQIGTSGVVGRKRRSHKRIFERHLFIIAFKLAIFHCDHVAIFRAPQTISKLNFRICRVVAH